MSNHVSVDESCVSAFRELKGKREVNTVIYRMSDALGTCVVERQANLTQDELLSVLPAHEPRLVLHDLAFASVDGARRNKILLISWLPRGISPRREAAYVHGHAALLRRLDGGLLSLRAADSAALDYRRLVNAAQAGARSRGGSGTASGSPVSVGQTGASVDGTWSAS
ncbi:cofilin family protein [Streptomyces sp. NPDC002516]